MIMKQKIQQGNILRLSDEQDGGRFVNVMIGESKGYAELRVVWNLERTKSGLIAYKSDGSWWWVRPLGSD